MKFHDNFVPGFIATHAHHMGGHGNTGIWHPLVLYKLGSAYVNKTNMSHKQLKLWIEENAARTRSQKGEKRADPCRKHRELTTMLRHKDRQALGNTALPANIGQLVPQWTSLGNMASPANIGQLVPQWISLGNTASPATLGNCAPVNFTGEYIRHTLQTLGIWRRSEHHRGIWHPLQTLGMCAPVNFRMWDMAM